MKRTPLKAKRDTPRRNEGRVTHERMKRKKTVKLAAEKRHHDRIAQLPCCVCGRHGVQVHHVISDGYKRITRDHRFVLPLCPAHHNDGPDAVHRHDAAVWNARHGIDQLRLAETLWEESNG